MTYALRSWWGLPQVAFVWLMAGALLLSSPDLRQMLDNLIAQRLGVGLRAMAYEAPDLAGGPPMAPAFVLPFASYAEREQAVTCLSEAVYYEAGNEPLTGQRAVAQVVLNRVHDRNFPASVCGVVYQGWQRATGCQFSFVCDGSMRRRPPSADQLAAARVVAEEALDGRVEPEVGTATHYHATYVNPYWGPTLVQITQVGAHIFYRWPGKAGLPEALTNRYAGGELRFAMVEQILRS